MDDLYKNIEEYNPDKKRKILIVFDDMIAGMLNNVKLNPIVTELFITHFFFYAKKYQTKFYPLFHYKNYRQISTSTNCI